MSYIKNTETDRIITLSALAKTVDLSGPQSAVNPINISSTGDRPVLYEGTNPVSRRLSFFLQGDGAMVDYQALVLFSSPIKGPRNIPTLAICEIKIGKFRPFSCVINQVIGSADLPNGVVDTTVSYTVVADSQIVAS